MTVLPADSHVAMTPLAPISSARLVTSERQALLGALARTGRHVAGTVGEIVPVVGTVVRQVPPIHRTRALAWLGEIAERFPQAIIGAIRSLPRLYEEADAGVVDGWFEAGLRLAAENAPAGMAYFALESRTSLRVLHTGSTAVELQEAQGVLRKYVQMLSGSPASLRGTDRFRLLPPLEEFPSENEVAVPLRIDLLGTYEENFRLYRFVAAQLAGVRLQRRNFGQGLQDRPHPFVQRDHRKRGEQSGANRQAGPQELPKDIVIVRVANETKAKMDLVKFLTMVLDAVEK